MLPLNDADLSALIVAELATGGPGANTFDEAALQVIAHSGQSNLRSCRNLCYAIDFLEISPHRQIAMLVLVTNRYPRGDKSPSPPYTASSSCSLLQPKLDGFRGE